MTDPLSVLDKLRAIMTEHYPDWDDTELDEEGFGSSVFQSDRAHEAALPAICAIREALLPPKGPDNIPLTDWADEELNRLWAIHKAADDRANAAMRDWSVLNKATDRAGGLWRKYDKEAKATYAAWRDAKIAYERAQRGVV